jgi:hypothetical protein
LTGVTFEPGNELEDTSIKLFQCGFDGLVSFDDFAVHGVTRLAGVPPAYVGGRMPSRKFDGR